MATDIEEKLKEFQYNSCRICNHYIRVNDKSANNVGNRRGFCILGQLDGDYGLYISSSVSRECMGFIYDEEVYKISKAEADIKEEERKYLHSLEDRRTNNHKLIKPVYDAHVEYLRASQDKINGTAWVGAIREFRRVACDHFEDINKERFYEIQRMVTLFESDYMKFMAQVSVEIHNRFCKCDCVEAKVVA
ncbi:MAG: hypothetical protein KAR20_15730 [Candidatus Heimdallarchaeota archaeon]|nr:hypothetical protein [Candidatus Heimdallarchaeota archaeon]